MLENLFQNILKMSFNASIVTLAVLIARFALKRAPKKWSYLLWGTVGFRLVFPISLKSVFSIFSLIKFKQSESVMIQETAEMPIITPPTDTVVDLPTLEHVQTGVTEQIEQGSILVDSVGNSLGTSDFNVMKLLAVVWLIGFALIFIYGLVTSVRLKAKLSNSIKYEDNIYFSENIASPFVFGIFEPKIYVPFGISEDKLKIVIAHELCHISRPDHVFRLFAFLLLCAHWFNPFVWLGFILMGKDMELSCDEKVLSQGEYDGVEYSRTLLSLATQKRFPSPCPIAFGESGIKTRIKNALKWKRPGKILAFAAPIVALIVLAACSLDPAERKNADITGEHDLWNIEYSSPVDWLDYSGEEYPSFRVNDNMNLQVKNDVNFPSEDWITMVQLEEKKLTKSALSDVAVDRFDVEVLLKENTGAYYGEWEFSEENTACIWFLKQFDGNTYLVMGYTVAQDEKNYVCYIFSLAPTEALKWKFNPSLSFTGWSQVAFIADTEREYTEIEIETTGGELSHGYFANAFDTNIVTPQIGNKINIGKGNGFIWSPYVTGKEDHDKNAVISFTVKNGTETVYEGRIKIFELPGKDELIDGTYCVMLDAEGLSLKSNDQGSFVLTDKTETVLESTQTSSTTPSMTEPPVITEPPEVTENTETSFLNGIEPYTADNLYIKGYSIFDTSENISVDYVVDGETVFSGIYLCDNRFDIPNYMRNSVWKEVDPKDFKFTDNYILYGFDSGASFCIYNVGWGDIEITDKHGNKYYFTLVELDLSRKNPWSTAKGEVEDLIPFNEENVGAKIQKMTLQAGTMSAIYSSKNGTYSAQKDDLGYTYICKWIINSMIEFKEVSAQEFETSDEFIIFEFNRHSSAKLCIFNVNGGNLLVTDDNGNNFYFESTVLSDDDASLWNLAKLDFNVFEISGEKDIIYYGKTAEEAMLDYSSPKTFEKAMNLSPDNGQKITEYAVHSFDNISVSDDGNIIVFSVLYYVKPLHFDKFIEAGAIDKYGADMGQWAYWASNYTYVAMRRIRNTDTWKIVVTGGSLSIDYVEEFYPEY